MPDSDHDDQNLPDFGLGERHEVGPAHFGLLLFIGALYPWFGSDEPSRFQDWVGLGLFMAACGLWVLDPPPQRLWRHPLGMLVGAVGVAYGWWFQRLPILIAGALVTLVLPATVLRRMRKG